MRLSEAIRKGSQLRPQVFGAPFKDGGSCALGAAYEGVFGCMVRPGYLLEELGAHFGVKTIFGPVTLPNGKRIGTLEAGIEHLNDHERWTREAIADWLATLGL